MKRFLILPVALLGLFLGLSLTACQNTSNPETERISSAPKEDTMEAHPAFENIDVNTFKKKMQEENTVILDVRTPAEVQSGMIDGAINIDISQTDFQEKIGQLDKNKTYLVYCQSGGRSSRACDIMAEMGFDSLFNLEEGFMVWSN